MRWMIIVGALGMSSSARADQCEVVDADHATWAAKLLPKGAVVAKFCESCGDTKPGAPTTVTTTTSKAVAGGKKTVVINGKPADLAYTYLQTGKSTWTNVGLLVGCPVTGGTPIYTAVAEAKLVSTGTYPAECVAYFNAVDKLAQCKKMPKESAAAMKQATDAMKQSLQGLPPDARASIVEGCKQATQALAQATKSVGC